MLNTPDIIIYLLAASTSIFAVSIIAHVQKCLELNDKIKITAFFISIPVLLFISGILISGLIQSSFEGMDSWMWVVLLIILGVRFIMKAFKRKVEERFFDYTRWNVLLGLSIGLGMDYLILGLGIEFTTYDTQNVLILLVICAFLAVLSGLYLGKKTGKFEWGNRMLYLGGLLFIGMAAKELVNLLGVI